MVEVMEVLYFQIKILYFNQDFKEFPIDVEVLKYQKKSGNFNRKSPPKF